MLQPVESGRKALATTAGLLGCQRPHRETVIHVDSASPPQRRSVRPGADAQPAPRRAAITEREKKEALAIGGDDEPAPEKRGKWTLEHYRSDTSVGWQIDDRGLPVENATGAARCNGEQPSVGCLGGTSSASKPKIATRAWH